MPISQSSTERPITRTSLIEALRQRLQEDILSGRYPAGTTLPPERELAARYGVTRTSLKHALIELRSLGLIAIRHGIGSIVEDVAARAGADVLQHMARREGGWDLRLLEDLLEARSLIGGLFAREAAQRRTRDDLVLLRQSLDGVYAAEGDAAAVQRADNVFWRALTDSTHLRTFVFLANSIAAVYSGTLESFRPAFEDGPWVADSLRRVFEAVSAGTPAQAEEETSTYLRHSAQRMMDAVRSSSSGQSRSPHAARPRTQEKG